MSTDGQAPVPPPPETLRAAPFGGLWQLSLLLDAMAAQAMERRRRAQAR